MDIIRDKMIWIISVFGVSFLGSIFALGRLFQRVQQLESDKKILHKRVDDVKASIVLLDENLDKVIANQSEMLGYLRGKKENK